MNVAERPIPNQMTKWKTSHATGVFPTRHYYRTRTEIWNVGELVWRLRRKIVDCVLFLITNFFQISKNRSSFLRMIQLDLLSIHIIIIHTIRVDRVKRNGVQITALEATGQKKKTHVVDTTSVAGTQHSGTCRIENTTCRALNTPAHAFYRAFLNVRFLSSRCFFFFFF